MKQRKDKILTYLANKREFVTAVDLADEFEVSSKTIYRWVKRINDHSTHGELIASSVGNGYKLNYENYINYQTSETNLKVDDLSPQKRRSRVTKELLLSSPKAIQVNDLFRKYYISESVIFKDELMIADNLKKYDLDLVKKDRSLVITGPEVNIRKAIKDHIEIFNVIDIDELKNNQDLNFNRNDVLFILDQLNLIEETLDISIPYPYNINIFSHLYILLRRTKQPIKILIEAVVSEEELNSMKEDAELYHMSKLINSNIEKYLDVELEQLEIYFIYQYLSSSRMQGSIWNAKKLDNDVIDITKLYINNMADYLGVKISKDVLFRDLANHIKPMINRLNHNIKVKNNLLTEIKSTYNEIFTYVENVSKQVSAKFNLPQISEDENGFITLYFAKIMETHQYQHAIKIIIMCTTGIGTSELLRAKITRDFPEIEVVDVISSSNYQSVVDKGTEVDLVVSTVKIPDNILTPYLLVSSMFTSEDKLRLQNKIGELYE